MEYKSLKELCQFLSISLETGRNWLRLGKIIPDNVKGREAFFKEATVYKLQESLESGDTGVLQSRRNKRYIFGNQLYKSYISETSVNVEPIVDLIKQMEETDVEPSEENIRILLAECAIQLCLGRMHDNKESKNYNCNRQSFLLEYLNGKLFLGAYKCFIEDLLERLEHGVIEDYIQTHPQLFQTQYIYEEQEDILGLLYLSVRNLRNRKAKGAYYTPTTVVKKVVKAVEDRIKDKKFGEKFTVLDPCCGTGNFLLQLPKEYKLEHIFGNDIDEISVIITRINLVMKHQPKQVDILYKNITKNDFLLEYGEKKFDWIIGNPPWGAEFSMEEKKELADKYETANVKNPESYDIFLEKAICMAKKQGMISFVLPEAIMNVKSHEKIRSIMMSNTSICYLEYLGNVFDKVYCPSIILHLNHTEEPMSCVGMKVKELHREYAIQQERILLKNTFSFYTSDEEYAVLEKVRNLSNMVTLKNHAEFALGIVTGDNHKFLNKTPGKYGEVIMKGAHVDKYVVNPIDTYIHYAPEKFQQIAAEKYYRAPEKLVYRFVSKQLIFAYDNQQRLTLNSCNMVIPRIEGLDIKYILAVLNSSVAQFVFEKLFHSVKVLRSHIEQIPIPYVDKEIQEKIVTMVDAVIKCAASDEAIEKKSLEENLHEKEVLKKEIDWAIAKLYGVNKEEYNLILQSGCKV